MSGVKLGAVNLAFAAGALVLAFEPVTWLVRTWFAPAYDSPGLWIFGAAAALFIWSVTSDAEGHDRRHRRWAYGLLLGTAVLRLTGHILAINVVGALALTVDVFAVGLLLGLGHRKRAVSPFWLAILFSFSLPLERIVQRLVGYGLQHLSAAGSCGALGVFFDDLQCAGVEMTLAGTNVLVDLPCSGARGLVLLGVLFAGLAAVARPTVVGAVAGSLLALGAALVSNIFRISVLAVGIAFPEWIGGIDVMAQPWHDIVGLGALALGAAPLVVWMQRVRPRQSAEGAETTSSTDTTDDNPGRTLAIAVAFIVLAGGVFVLPKKPVDVAEQMDALQLPASLGGHHAVRHPLDEMERDYFTRYGGAAAKASYGDQSLLVVRTSAPLRHLHDPSECLSGAGFDVEMAGITGNRLPGATYRVTMPEGHGKRAGRWLVVATYVSDDGQTATNVSEAVWKWMRSPETTWTSVQRMFPAGASAEQRRDFDHAVARAFDIASQPDDSTLAHTRRDR
ncbi:MAG: exosortase T [Myxococcota bacterium]